MSGQKRAIIIDTDPGQDDAVAIWLALAASSRLDVLALTTVAGNVPLPQATTNALRLCAAAGAGMTRIHAGADRPLLVPLETAEFVCGKDGLDGAVGPAADAPSCMDRPRLSPARRPQTRQSQPREPRTPRPHHR